MKLLVMMRAMLTTKLTKNLMTSLKSTPRKKLSQKMKTMMPRRVTSPTSSMKLSQISTIL